MLQDKKSRKHRAKYGWAPSDVWNVDTYISEVLSGMVDHLAVRGQSLPMTVDPLTWDGILAEMSNGFHGWAKHFECDTTEEEEQAYKNVQNSLRLLTEWFSELWD